MSDASYERQHLAVHAAGFINGAGTTRLGFGCQMTRFSVGHYGLLLDPSAGVVDDQSFTVVQMKGILGAGNPRTSAVEDVSAVRKDIRIFNATTFADSAIEVTLWKSVAR